MVYFLQRIKQETSKELWHEFKTTYPHMLTGVPTTGRMIRWEELDEPSPPPVFGNTTEHDLLWKLPPPRPPRELTVDLAGSKANYYWKKIGRSVKYEARAVGRTIRRAKNETKKVLGIGIGCIRIHADAMQYRLGDIVDGALLLQLTDPIPASRLVVQIRAFRTEKKIVLDSNGRPHTRTSNKTLHQLERQLDGKRTYLSGQQFHFSLQIPSQIESQFQLSKDLSGTRIGNVLSVANAVHQSVRSMTDSTIHWTLSAYLEIPWKVNLTRVVQLNVDNKVPERGRVN
jgi:hypothetical protein